MRKINLLLTLSVITLIVVNCSQTKKAAGSKPSDVQNPMEVEKPKPISFAKDIMPALKVSCTPCHFPPGGNKEPLDTYAAVKSHIGEVLERVKMPKDARGYMPFMSKKPAFSDSTIKVLEQWQKEGMAE